MIGPCYWKPSIIATRKFAVAQLQCGRMRRRWALFKQLERLHLVLGKGTLVSVLDVDVRPRYSVVEPVMENKLYGENDGTGRRRDYLAKLY